ncbi:MAG TPA: pseudouridine synthase [Opitutaceae bacterium]|jgi:23S rRNA pseudouridine2605 synthase|nr:pseudouridine synthase [Opitutaceae bacterium]
MSEDVRLQKYLADAGVCSRRAAEALIAAGEVWVNGKAAVPGQKIVPGADKVTVEGKTVRATAQPKITLVVHKPRGLVCSNDDPFNPENVFSLVPRELARLRFFCAGRLDKESEGLVILTTDGDLANRLMHPSHRVVKRYHVSLKNPFPAARLPLLVKGITVEGERLKVERASLVNASPAGESRDLDLHMEHGKKREIRQLLTVLGYDVRRLRRYQIGAIRLQGIPLRGGRQLSTKEIDQLFHSPRTPRAAWTASAESLP